MKNFVLAKAHPQMMGGSHMENCDVLYKKIEKEIKLAVGVYFGEPSGKLHDEFKKLSDPVGGMDFLTNVNPNCAKKYRDTRPFVVMFMSSKNKYSVYDGPADAQSIVDFMEPKLYTGLNDLHVKDYNNLQETELNQLVLFVSSKNAEADYVKEFR